MTCRVSLSKPAFAYRPGDYYFSCGLGVIERDGKYGYIDAEGNLVIDCIYDAGYTFEDGLASGGEGRGRVADRCVRKTFMNLSERQLNAYSGFSEGFCAVSSEAEGENWGLTGYIDKKWRACSPDALHVCFRFPRWNLLLCGNIMTGRAALEQWTKRGMSLSPVNMTM